VLYTGTFLPRELSRRGTGPKRSGSEKHRPQGPVSIPGWASIAIDQTFPAVLAAWLVAGLLLSLRFFRWDPHRPGHARRPA
jgi:hypothetical protein